ncbi:LacI family DNA-binding transcriptional regulator [Salinactinospora qingdaonensis]|uniref:LacI family DNA-binding transcriptional regulator n=1 Tax=Salinactinospora qingdaonensis TaxID=702744 RepID=A0ABP7FK66_9ACTN
MVTIADVARHAGVSISTVSYVLSGKRSISADTERKVRDSIHDLGYQPNAGARALASSKSNVLALVVPLRSDMNLPVLMQFATGVVTAARAHEHDVLLLTQDEGVAGLRRVAGTALTDAIIVMDVEQRDPRIDVLRRLHQPSVLIGVPEEPSGLACVDLDFAAAGGECVDHLCDLGHRSLGFIGAPTPVYERGTSFARRTLAGFQSAAERRGVAAASVACDPSYAGVRDALAELRAKTPDLTGVIVHNEDALAPLLDIVQAEGSAIPDDLSIVAICPDQHAQNLPVPVSAVTIPTEEIARNAVEMVMHALDSGMDAEVRLLSPELHIRASSGPAPVSAPREANAASPDTDQARP